MEDSDGEPRSERKAIQRPSGENSGLVSWPDWVSCSSNPEWPGSSRYSHKSLRKRFPSQSARVVSMATAWPSGASRTVEMSTELKNSSSVRSGLEEGVWARAAVQNKHEITARWRQKRMQIMLTYARGLELERGAPPARTRNENRSRKQELKTRAKAISGILLKWS